MSVNRNAGKEKAGQLQRTKPAFSTATGGAVIVTRCGVSPGPSASNNADEATNQGLMSDSIIPLPERPNLADAGPWGVCAVMEEYVLHGPGDLKSRWCAESPLPAPR